MTARTPFYVTTPIYYVNDVPHIGHAYTTLACDVLARFKRLDGFDVRFLTGTDEHGQKVEKSARDAGMEPGAFTAKVAENFRELCRHMNFSNDDFIRTTEPRHLRACQALWRKLKENGHIVLGAYKGWYAVRDEAFYDESELTAGADGRKVAPSGAAVEWVEEPSYFFRLSAWQKPLLDFYEANPGFILPLSRRNEVVSFVKFGLRDLSVSRTSFRWGVPVPDDPAHIMYVWLDALTNYITAVGYPDFEGNELGRYWPADLHMVGKDILRFHAIYWPAFLMAAGIKPPKRVFAHGWWTNEGEKISKSVGNVIDPIALIGTYGLDPVRYFLLREVPFGNDGDFSHRAMVNRMNGELANDYGNLAQRVLSMIARNCSGRVPEPGARTPEDKALMEAGEGMLVKLRAAMDVQAFHEAIEHLWVVIRAANAYVDRQAPWKLKTEDPARMGTVLYALAETIRKLAILTQPFVPESSGRLLDQLAVPLEARAFEALVPGRELKPGTALPEPKGVFPRHVEPEGKGPAAPPSPRADSPERVLDFWFKEHGPKDWFAKNPEFDAKIRAGFGPLYDLAVEGKLDRWADTPKGALALIVMLDQFSRNLHRDGAKAFAGDARALRLAKRAVEQGFHKSLGEKERAFLFLPFEHSEDPRDQELSIKHYAELGDKSLLEWAEKHKAIIDRFGRYPHRNAALGRESTPEEIAFLAGPRSSF